MRRLWKSLYDKVRAMGKGYLYGGGAAAVVTEILAVADVSDLSSAERIAWSLGTAAVLGILNAYRTPENREPTPTPPAP